MAFALVFLGIIFGLACAVIAVAIGEFGTLAALGIYSGSGASVIILWAFVVAMKSDEEPMHDAIRSSESAAIHR